MISIDFILRKVQMGAHSSLQNADLSHQKQAQLTHIHQSMVKECDSRQFIQGSTAAQSKNIALFDQKEKFDQILQKIVKQFSHLATEDFRFIFDNIAHHIHAYLSKNISPDSFVSDSRTYPIMTKEGFSIVYCSFYVEKVMIERETQCYRKIILMNVFKIITPDPPKTKYELGSIISASSIEKDKIEYILDHIWSRIQSKKTSEQCSRNEKKRLAKLSELRQFECD